MHTDDDQAQTFTLDALDDWASAGLIQADQAVAIRAYLAGRTAPAAGADVPEASPGKERRGLSLVTIAYYFGAFLILFAYTVFVGLSWEGLGQGGRVVILVMTVAVLGAIGVWLRTMDNPTAGGLLIFVALSLVPLLSYSIQDALGIWPSDEFNADENYAEEIAPAIVAVEVATIAACLALIGAVRFPLLILQASVWSWLLAMDLTRVVRRSEDWSWDDPVQGVGLCVGLALLGLSVWRRRYGWGREAFWLALSGHSIVLLHATSLGLAEGGLPAFLYLLLYLGVVASVWLQSRLFLVFGALGVYGYVSYLAFSVFDGTLGFTVALALIGLAIVLGAVGFQHVVRPQLEEMLDSLDYAHDRRKS